MKFCKVLESQAKDMPDDMFGGLLRYKQLKKKIKAIPVVEPPKLSEGDQQQADEAAARSVEDEEVASTSMTARGIAAGPSSGSHLSPEELEFLSALNEDLRRINSFFIDKEEDAVIKLHDMEDQLTRRSVSQEALKGIKSRLVDFHGELVLILHWSLTNYSAIVKILKKHDKRTGVLLRVPCLANVLQQPFNSTGVMSRLVHRCNELVEKANDLIKHGHSSDDDESLPLKEPVPRAYKRTERALEMWESLAKTASTPSTLLGHPPAEGEDSGRHIVAAAGAKRKAGMEQAEPIAKKAF